MRGFFLPVWLLLAAACFADSLTFPETSKEIQAAADATEAGTDFHFTNRSGKTLEIKRYESSCSCLAADAGGGKLRYAPGESGIIRAKFDIATATGEMEKQIGVWMKDDPEDKPSIQLTLKVKIPEVVSVEPKTLKWDIGGPVTAQSIHFTVDPNETVRIKNITCPNENFKHQLKTLEEGRKYELVITPVATAEPSLAIFRIETDSRLEKHRQKMAYAVVKRPLASEAKGSKP